MQLARPKDGGSVYTEWDIEVRNGNSGLEKERVGYGDHVGRNVGSKPSFDGAGST